MNEKISTKKLSLVVDEMLPVVRYLQRITDAETPHAFVVCLRSDSYLQIKDDVNKSLLKFREKDSFSLGGITQMNLSKLLSPIKNQEDLKLFWVNVRLLSRSFNSRNTQVPWF
jgi:hypothetical protein